MFLFAVNSRGYLSILGLQEENKKIRGTLCRLPSAVNVMLKLSNIFSVPANGK